MKLVGSSIIKESVYCYYCVGKYVWLNAYSDGQGGYIPYCAKCIRTEYELKHLRRTKK